MANVVLAQALTSTSQFALLVACQTWAVYQGGEHSGYLAALSALYAVPLLLNRPIGRLVDRIGPRPVGVAAHLAGAVVLLAALLFAPTPLGVLITATVSSAIRVAAQASADALATWLPSRPPVTAASVWITLAQAAPLIAGSTAAVALTTTVGLSGALLALVASSVVGAVVCARTPSSRPTAPAELGGAQPHRTWLWIIYALTFASYSVVELTEPGYFSSVVHAPAWMLAASNAGFGIAACAGAMVLKSRHDLLEHRAALPIGIAAVAAAETVMVATSSAVVAVGGAVAWGAAVSVLAPATRTRLLRGVAPSDHGLALGTMRSLRAVASFAAAAGSGPLAAGIGVQGTAAVFAVLLAACVPLTRNV
ncbi:hypothetical protein [Streptacidiphilus sp. MAP5-52]|uniref:hypothetical protein n=1 Tax=Streptacidiphilus sp. MAP5-52 TaxID=3156267 RepID=UPI003513770F